MWAEYTLINFEVEKLEAGEVADGEALQATTNYLESFHNALKSALGTGMKFPKLVHPPISFLWFFSSHFSPPVSLIHSLSGYKRLDKLVRDLVNFHRMRAESSGIRLKKAKSRPSARTHRYLLCFLLL